MARWMTGLTLAAVLVAAGSMATAQEEKERTAADVIRALPDLKDVDIAIPWNDFKGILEKMLVEKKEKPLPRPPVDYVLGAAVYDATVTDGTARVRGKMTLTVLADGWVRVPLVGADLALGAVEVDGKPGVVVTADGRYELILQKAGTYAVQLTAAAKVVEERGRSRFSLRVPQTSGAQLSVTVPDAEAAVEIAPAAEVTSQRAAKAVTATASLPVTDAVTVSWQRKVEEPEVEAAKVFADVASLVAVGEGFLRSYSVVQYQVLHAGIDRLRLALPKGVTVLDVTGDAIRDWKTASEADRDVLAVTLNYPVRDRYGLSVTFEQGLPEAQVVAVPALAVLDVEREKGYLGVSAEANVEIGPAEAENARPVDVKELPGVLAQMARTPLLLGYRYASQPFRAAVEVRRLEDESVLTTIVDRLSATTMQTEAGRRITRLRMLVRNNQRQFLKLAMPEGATVWSAFVGDRAVKPGRDQEGRLLLPLAKSAREADELAAFPMELVYTQDVAPLPTEGAGDFAADLPAVDVPATIVVWSVFLPEGREFTNWSGSINRLEEEEAPTVDQGVSARTVTAAGKQLDETVKSQSARQAEQLRQETLDALRRGATPIRISVPERGQLFQFQKLLVTNESLTIAADWKGRRKRGGWFFGL